MAVQAQWGSLVKVEQPDRLELSERLEQLVQRVRLELLERLVLREQWETLVLLE